MTDEDDRPVRERRHTLVVALISALVSGAIAIAGIVTGTILQTSEQRAKDDRERRAEIYLTFLDKANAYDVAVSAARGCVLDARASTPTGSTSNAIEASCSKRVGELLPVRYDFVNARNKVFVYGSEEAENKASVIAAVFPSIPRGNLANRGFEIYNDLAAYDSERLGVLYLEFLGIVCSEVPAQPRESCGS